MMEDEKVTRSDMHILKFGFFVAGLVVGVEGGFKFLFCFEMGSYHIA